LVDTVWCTMAPYKRFHALNCGFLSKFVTFDEKYPKCQKSIKKLLNKSYSRESRANFPGKRE
jgi:hypothetical protein